MKTVKIKEKFSHKKRAVYLKLLWIGENSLKFDRKIKLAITNCFGTVQPRVVFSTRQVFLQYIRTFFPLFDKAMSYMNACAIVIVGTWFERPNVCRTESIRMCRSLFGIEPVKNENNLNAKVN